MLAVDVHNMFKAEINTQPLLQHICRQTDNNIYLDYRYFKYIATKENYGIIIQHILTVIDEILKIHSLFTVHVYMKSLTIAEIDKHKTFIYTLANTMKLQCPDKLDTCFVYKAPFIFSHLYNMISMFIDKETQDKIKIIE